jgi:hypothetical protein
LEDSCTDWRRGAMQEIHFEDEFSRAQASPVQQGQVEKESVMGVFLVMMESLNSLFRGGGFGEI